MPLRRKLLFINLVLILGLVTISAAILWGLGGLARTVSDAVDEYTELQIVEGAILHANTARLALESERAAPGDPREELNAALRALGDFRRFQHDEEDRAPEHQSDEARFNRAALADITEAIAALDAADGEGAADPRLDALRLTTAAVENLKRLADKTSVADSARAASSRVSRTIAMIAAAAVLLVAGSIVVSVAGYRAIIRPLQRLQSGVRRLATGHFDERLPAERDPEFATLADDFNRMSAELSELYRDLHDRVTQKSRELARSERLASVGFLAAGVAHEINNPLGIISGYAELSGRWLDSGTAPPSPRSIAEVRDAMKVIAEEASRCKEITAKLLSMSRMGDGARTTISLSAVAAEVVRMLRGLHRSRKGEIALDAAPDSDTLVVGNDSELKQVVLNLLVNALDAVNAPGAGPPGRRTVGGLGRVRIEVRRRGSTVHLEVIDDGCGMTPDVLEHVFEPFFSAREAPPATVDSVPRRGVGLGLSISHAIAEGHGGSLRAESRGPGRGSRFTLSLPAAHAEPASAAREGVHVVRR